MIYKAELVVAGITVNVTDDIKNWDDITMSLKRSDYGGVIRSYSDKFEFVGTAYDILRQEYRSKLMNPSADLVLSTRNNNHLYDERFRCALDFASLTDDGYAISMNALDSSLAALIKANKSQTYDIPVNDIKDTEQLDYDRLDMKYQSTFIGIPDNYDDNEIVSSYELSLGTTYSSYTGKYALILTFPVSTVSGDEKGGKFIYGDIIKTQITSNITPEGGNIRLNDNQILMECVNNIKGLHINFNFQFWFHKKIQSAGENLPGRFISRAPWALVLFKGIKQENGSYNLIKLKSLEQTQDGGTVPIDWKITADFNVGDILTFMVFVPVLKYEDDEYIRAEFSTYCSVYYDPLGPQNLGTSEYISRFDNIKIDVVNSVNLLSRLVQEISGKNINCIIEEPNYGNELINKRFKSNKIVAAESIRGIKNAKIHTSFKKFSEWMEYVFGYIYKIEGEEIKFMHRNTLFNRDITKIINEIELNNFSLSFDNPLIYSGIKIGYDKQDYDSVNGRDEFRFSNNYSTGNILADTTKEMISPYRADAYGIEFLAQKRKEKTTDDSSDNDVFFVACVKSGNNYILLREGWNIEGVLSGNTMFNVMYSPRSMVEANKSFIGACTNSVKFTASEGNADITINGVSEKEPVAITDAERLFTPYKVELDTSNIELPEDSNALIAVTYQGEEYQGYVSDIDTRFTREEECKYTLMVKTIN